MSLKKLWLGVLFANVIGCAGAEDSGVPSCVPGASASCTCQDGSPGAQLCAENGTFSTCQCSAAGGARPPAESSGGAGASGGGSSDHSRCVELQTNFTQDTTIAEGCYLVRSTPSLAEDAALTISPGATLVFSRGAGLIIRRSQSLYAEGIDGKPILFTGEMKEPGAWRGIAFDSTQSTHRFRFVTVEYAGGVPTGTEHSHPPANLASVGENHFRIDDSIIRSSAGYGLALDISGSSLGSFERNTITGNDVAALVPAYLSGRISASGAYTGNNHDRVELTGGGISGGLNGLGVPYYVPAGKTLSVTSAAPGAKVLMGPDSGIEIPPNGQWLGTPESPIHVLSEEPVPGFWRGIMLGSMSDAVLTHVTVEYGGTPSTGNIRMGESIDNTALLTLRNCTLAHSAGVGFFGFAAPLTFVSDLLANNRFVDNALGDTNFEL